ncbi:MAG TPA: hypothetical protein VFN44_18750, partial [Solirubrobacteraceae bacterium]|nr:hypothetical protein [Solirubrobacteraceae bacterium]
MDKAIDPKIAEGLAAAWLARDALALPAETVDAIAAEIPQVARGPFFRFPNVRLNQINWPLELAAYDALVTGQGDLLRQEYALQLGRFLAGVRRPWIEPARWTTTTNLAPSYRFHYLPNRPESRATNLDSAEYANITLHFLAFYDEARRAGMPPPSAGDTTLLRAWLQRTLFGYWTHSGLLNWDTGLGLRRWMKGKTWAYAQQGLLAIATAARFHRDPLYRRWAKTIFDHGLDAYERMAGAGLAASNLYGVTARIRAGSDDVLFAARMAANAARAVAAGLGRAPGAEPPPFYAFDADIGRLAVSTPAYSTAVVAVNRGAFPYGGIELARLLDARGEPLTGIGGTSPAALGIVIRDATGRELLGSQHGLHHDPARPPLILTRSPQGPVRRLERLPADPAAGPFEVLEAVGRRRSGRFAITTRHRFTANAIEETWNVRRRGRGFASVVAQLPSWGAGSTAEAVLAAGETIPLVVGAPAIPLQGVRELRLGGYRVELERDARGSLRAVPTVPGATNPDPGPTLELTFADGARFARARLAVRILPSSGV